MLKAILDISGESYLVKGGYYVDGTVFNHVDKKEIEEVVTKIKESNIRNIVISGSAQLTLKTNT